MPHQETDSRRLRLDKWNFPSPRITSEEEVYSLIDALISRDKQNQRRAYLLEAELLELSSKIDYIEEECVRKKDYDDGIYDLTLYLQKHLQQYVEQTVAKHSKNEPLKIGVISSFFATFSSIGISLYLYSIDNIASVAFFYPSVIGVALTIFLFYEYNKKNNV